MRSAHGAQSWAAATAAAWATLPVRERKAAPAQGVVCAGDVLGHTPSVPQSAGASYTGEACGACKPRLTMRSGEEWAGGCSERRKRAAAAKKPRHLLRGFTPTTQHKLGSRNKVQLGALSMKCYYLVSFFFECGTYSTFVRFQMVTETHRKKH